MVLHCSVAEAQQRIDSREFTEWFAYDRIDPFGERRADLRSAMIACVIANANRGKGQRAYGLDDFMLDFSGGGKKRQDWQDIQASLFGWAKIHNQVLKNKA